MTSSDRQLEYALAVVALFLNATALQAAEMPFAVENEVRGYLTGQYPDAAVVQITDARMPNDLGEYAGHAIRVETPRVLRRTGPIPFRLMTTVDGIDRSIGTAWIQAAVLYDALVAKTSLKRETKLKEALLVTKRVDVRKINGSPLREWRDDRDLRLKRTVREGAAILTTWIEAVPDVSRGERIHVFGRNHGLEVALTGTAMEEGFVGDIITVRNESSGKRIEVEVTGRRRGEILQGDNG